MSVECFTDGAGLYISRSHPNRAVKECLLGWALYSKYDGEEFGERIGIADQHEAFKWLSGSPIEDVVTLSVVPGGA